MSDQHKEIKIADEKRFNFKQFVLTKIVKHWYLYVISLMVILPLAYYYNWYTTPQYNAVSTLLINDQKSKRSPRLTIPVKGAFRFTKINSLG